ncbi:MAG: O-antigen ligase family protein [Armatimonadota bacterium]
MDGSELARPGGALWRRAALAAGAALICLAAGLAAGVVPLPALLGVAAAIVVVLLVLRPEWGLPLALFAIPFDLLGHITPDGSVTVAKALILLVLVIWIGRALVLRDQYPLVTVTHPVALLMIAFLGMNILSFVNVIQLKPAALFLLRRTNVVVLALLIPMVLRDRRSWDRALIWMTLASVPIGFFGLYELATGRPILALVSYRSQDALLLLSGGQWRIHGTFDDGPFHAIYVVTAASLAVMWLLRSSNRWVRLGLCALLLLLFVNLVGTASRGGMMALVVVLIAFWAGYGGRRRWLIAAGAVAMAAAVLGTALLLPQVPVHRYLQVSSEDDPTTQIRLGLYDVAIGMVEAHPLLGVGTGQWVRESARFYSSGTFRSMTYMPHNTYLQVAAENGLLGLASYLVLLGAVTYYFLRALRGSSDKHERLAILSALGTFLAFAAFATTSNVLENETYWIFISFSMVASGPRGSLAEAGAGGA